jgi:hypothetical protein
LFLAEAEVPTRVAPYVPWLAGGALATLSVALLTGHLAGLKASAAVRVYVLASAASVGALLATQLVLRTIEFGEGSILEQGERTVEQIESLF